MPIAAKLSLRFYEMFGEEIANELVDWLNQVDAASRADLRELNELNFARFDAKLEQRLAEPDARWERRLAESNAHWERRLAEYRTELREVKADLIKWTFVFVSGGTLTILGTLIALGRP